MRVISTRKLLFIGGGVVAIAMACQIAFAGVGVKVEKKGTYTYWLTFKDAKGVDQATTPARFKGKETEFNPKLLGAKSTGAKVHIWDKRTGNEAIADYKPSADAKAKADVSIKQSDFQYVPSVAVKVVSEDGAPLAMAKVVLADGEGTKMLRVITPGDNGIATFSDVAIGDIEVKVAADGAKKTVDGEFELPEKRESVGFEREVKVTGDVDTLAVSAGKGKASEEPKTAGSAGILQTIVGLLFLGIVVAIVAVVLKSKGVTAKSALGQMGVNVPADQPIGSTGGVNAAQTNPNVCPFCGQTKDASGNCACSVSGSASNGLTSGGPSGPRLIGSQGTYSGNIFMISNGTAVIGREASNDVALPKDTTVSRCHATIMASNGSYSIRDEGSSNGTFVNGSKISSQAIMPGDEIQIGATKFRFEV